MSELRKYRVRQGGTETVLKLSDEDAKLYPDAELVDDDGAASKARVTSNKARSTENK